jgi:hypothetical protein
MPTKQEIVDRMRALGREHSAAYERERARIEAERKSLRELCAAGGHVFGFSRWGGRACVFCGENEVSP